MPFGVWRSCVRPSVAIVRPNGSSRPKSRPLLLSDHQRADLEELSELHFLMLMALFPDEPIHLLLRSLDIPDILAEYRARTIRAEAELQRLLQIQEDDAKAKELQQYKTRAERARTK